MHFFSLKMIRWGNNDRHNWHLLIVIQFGASATSTAISLVPQNG